MPQGADEVSKTIQRGDEEGRGPGSVIAAYAGIGTAFIFAAPNTGWNDMTPTAALEPPPGGAYAFGPVAISEKVVVAGDTDAPSYPLNYGAIFAFVEPDRGWQTTATPSAWYQGAPSLGSELLGYSVAVDGETAVAGAAGFKTDSGAAYVFVPQ
jgi:hypothetical protein